MANVDGGLLKCVLQLAACSDKLRSTDLLLGSYVGKMQKQLAPTDIPTLKARVAIVAADSVAPGKSVEEEFQEYLGLGLDAAERLEMAKAGLEKELQRQSEHFHEQVTSRNAGLQEEYKRMLSDLEEQEATIMQQIENERAHQQSFKRRRIEATSSMKQLALRAKESVEHENVQLQSQIEEFSAEITQLQAEFAELEEEARLRIEEPKNASASTEEEVDEQLSAQVESLRHEVQLLREAKESITATQKTSFKDQYVAEKAELDSEIAHLRQVKDEIQKQLSSHGKRLQALVGTLAPNSSTGSLMTRLYKQLMSDPSAGARKTVELQGFLKSCPSEAEGRLAIQEMIKLQLIYCYDSSGIIALAD